MSGRNNYMTLLRFAFFVMCGGLMFCAPVTRAQVSSPVQGGSSRNGDEAKDAEIFIELREDFLKKQKLRAPEVEVSDFRTMFYTPWQQTLAKDALYRHEMGAARIPVPAPKPLTEEPADAADLSGVEGSSDSREEEPPPEPGIRELRLGGILYESPRD